MLRVRRTLAIAAVSLGVLAGPATYRDAAWTSATINLDQFAGQTVQVSIDAADLGTASLLEAAVDDVRVSRL